MVDPNVFNAQGSAQFRAPSQVPAPQAAPQFVNHPQQAGLMNTPISRTKTFQFRYESDLDGQIYEGTFTCRKLSVRDLTQMGVRKVQLNGGFHYDDSNPGCGIEPHIDGMNAMIAHLEICIVQAPFWFKIEEIFDPKLLNEVYMKVAEFENSFFRRPGGQVQPGYSSQNVSSAAGQNTGSTGSVTPMGGGQIPPSMDP